jgi:N-acetylmuramoyl-L-alanine amidase
MAQPNGPRADDALFMTAHLYARSYKLFHSPQDKREALDYFNRLLNRFPGTKYRSEAEQTIAELTGEEKGRRGQTRTADEKGMFGLQTGSIAEVRTIRYWSSPTYTRVVIDVESEVPYAYRLVKKDPAAEQPERFLMDVGDTRIGPGVKPYVPIPDALLSDACATQHSPDTMRIVLDMKSIHHFEVFSLPNPFRIVVDVRGVPVKTASKERYKRARNKPGGKVPRGALAKQLALGVQRIVVDPGHGGRDPGAFGHLTGVVEKNVTLEIGRRLAEKIEQRLGCKAILTRNADTYLSLEERTAIANTENADLFISLHTNAHEKMASHGIETYFLNLATDEDAILVAARENAASARNISDLQDILSRLMKNAKQDESSRLARYVQEAMIKELSPKYGRISDKGVKEAPFYVLLGAQMPCILVEVAFITNPAECRRLNTAAYQDDIADAIATGIQRYMEDIQPMRVTQADI